MQPTNSTVHTTSPRTIENVNHFETLIDAFSQESSEQTRDLISKGFRNIARRNLETFATAFPHLCRLNWSRLHLHLLSRRLAKTRLPLPHRKGSTDVILAPRGAAKSTLVSLIFPLHAILYQRERYILLISATHRQAVSRLANIRTELQTNPDLKRLFPIEVSSFETKTRTSLLVNGVRIDAFSAGSELRGLTHGGWRPTWIVLDDVESSARSQNPIYREHLAEWMNEVIANLGDTYTNVDLIGTLMHPEALPARLAQRPDVTFEKFPSIFRESDREDLWTEWESKLFDLADPDRAVHAREFFDINAAEMSRGAEVLWPEKESYHDLRLLRASIGAPAFNKEKQNDPPEEGNTIFSMNKLRRFQLMGRRIHLLTPGELNKNETTSIGLEKLRVFGFLDPAMGEVRRSGGDISGDFAAITTVGIDEHGYLYVLDVWIDRAPPSLQIPKIFDLHQRWNYSEFGVETNAFQKFLLEPMEEERRRRNDQTARSLRVRGIRHQTNKRTRILSLEPMIHNGWLLFADHLNEIFIHQIEEFPLSKHDDGPDSLQGAVALARSSRPKLEWPLTRKTTPAKLRNY